MVTVQSDQVGGALRGNQRQQHGVVTITPSAPAVRLAALKQGSSGVKLQTSTVQGKRLKYQTRVVSNANKVNLKFEEAKPVLEAQLAKSVAGIL